MHNKHAIIKAITQRFLDKYAVDSTSSFTIQQTVKEMLINKQKIVSQDVADIEAQLLQLDCIKSVVEKKSKQGKTNRNRSVNEMN